MFNSVRFKLLFLTLLAVFAITTTIVWSDIEDTKERLISSQKEKAVLLSDIIKNSIMVLMIENRWKELQGLIEELPKNNPELNEVRIFHPRSGRIIVSADPRDVGRTIYAEDWKRFRKDEGSPFVIRKGDMIFATKITPILNVPSCYKCHPRGEKILGVLDVEVSLVSAQKSIADSRFKHLSGLIIGLVLISVIFMIGGERLINRPLSELINGMKRAESGDLSVVIKESGRDEFGYLSNSFNHMTASLKAAKEEAELCHLQQMEKTAKLASLGEIISGIAHEIKNPLAGISCAVQVFYSELPEDDTRRPVITEVLNQVNRLDRIVKDLLSYAKPKPLRFLSTSANVVLEKALFFVYPEAKKQGVIIKSEIPENMPEILIDPDQIQQVFMNIIINAIQAMTNGGVLTISASIKDWQEISGEVKSPLLCDKIVTVSFEDTGKGISAEDLPYLFDPFFTKKTKGTGLGLSISQKIVHEHGGEIAVKSELGKGSVFTVYLPVGKNNL